MAANASEPLGEVRMRRDRNSEGGLHPQHYSSHKGLCLSAAYPGTTEVFRCEGIPPHSGSRGEFFQPNRIQSGANQCKLEKEILLTGIQFEWITRQNPYR